MSVDGDLAFEELKSKIDRDTLAEPKISGVVTILVKDLSAGGHSSLFDIWFEVKNDDSSDDETSQDDL